MCSGFNFRSHLQFMSDNWAIPNAAVRPSPPATQSSSPCVYYSRVLSIERHSLERDQIGLYAHESLRNIIIPYASQRTVWNVKNIFKRPYSLMMTDKTDGGKKQNWRRGRIGSPLSPSSRTFVIIIICYISKKAASCKFKWDLLRLSSRCGGVGSPALYFAPEAAAEYRLIFKTQFVPYKRPCPTNEESILY